MYATFNGGSTWANITAGLPDSLYYTSVDVSESDKKTACVTLAGFTAGCKVFKTTNGGSTWQNVSFNLPNVPVNCVKFIPGSNDMMIATDLGIFVLKTNGTSWTNLSAGLPNVILSDIEFNPALNKVYLTTFGRGIWASDLSSFTTSTTSIKTNSLEFSEFTLYPAVNNGSFKLTNAGLKPFTLEIIDVSGKVLCTENLSGKKDYAFNLTLPSGMYYAKISNERGMEVKRFIVE